MRTCTIICWLFIFSFPTLGQDTARAYKSVPALPAVAYSVDRTGFFYIAFANGTIAKYDGDGIEVLNFSPRRAAKVDLIDAWNPLKIFVFYEEFQSVVILDRFLNPIGTYDLSGKVQGFIKLACPSQDNTFWLIDEAYKGLVKYDPAEQQVIYRTPFANTLPTNIEVLYMREYQNLLFLSLSSGGILYFDNLGNYLGKIETAAAIRFFGFTNNQLYYLAAGAVQYVNLYNRNEGALQLPSRFENVLDLGTYKVGIKKEGGFDLLR